MLELSDIVGLVILCRISPWWRLANIRSLWLLLEKAIARSRVAEGARCGIRVVGTVKLCHSKVFRLYDLPFYVRCVLSQKAAS
jgi:hypothetical protein